MALASAVKLAREIAAETGLAPARIDGLLALKGVIVQDEAVALDPVARAHRDAEILKSLAMTFDALSRARTSEGAKLAQLLRAQMDEVARLVDEAEGLAAAQPEALRQQLTAQMQELLTGAPLSEDRLAQEVALLATRADVREELDRLKAHVQDARALLEKRRGGGPQARFPVPGIQPRSQYAVLQIRRYRADPRGPGAEGGDRPVPRAGPECRMTQ